MKKRRSLSVASMLAIAVSCGLTACSTSDSIGMVAASAPVPAEMKYGSALTDVNDVDVTGLARVGK